MLPGESRCQLTTLLAILILVGVALIGLMNIVESGNIWLLGMVVLPLAI